MGFIFSIYYFYKYVYNINRNRCIVAGTVYRHNIKGTDSNIPRSPASGLQMAGILIFRPTFLWGILFFLTQMSIMVTGNFYYIKDSYYDKFPNCDLIGNKNEDIEGKHDRPCFYCFKRLTLGEPRPFLKSSFFAIIRVIQLRKT